MIPDTSDPDWLPKLYARELAEAFYRVTGDFSVEDLEWVMHGARDQLQLILCHPRDNRAAAMEDMERIFRERWKELCRR